MSILLDLGRDLEIKSNMNGLSYKDVKLDKVDKKENYINNGNIYITIKESDIDVLDLRDTDKVIEFQRKCNLSLVSSANKVLVQGGNYSKKNMSSSPLAICFNLNTIVEKLLDKFDFTWRDYLVNINTLGFEAMLKLILDDNYKTEMTELQSQCTRYLTNNCDNIINILSNVDNNAQVRIIYDIDISHYEKANRFYYRTLLKTFGDSKKVVNYKDEIYGYNLFVNTNSKKPMLISSIRSSENDAYSISVVSNMTNPRELLDLPYNVKVIEGKSAKDNMYYWDYDTKEVVNKIKKNIYIGKDKRYSVAEVEMWQLKQYIENAYYDKGKTLPKFKRQMFDNVIKQNKVNYDLFNNVKNDVLLEIIKEVKCFDIKKKGVYTVSHLNTLLSIDDYIIDKIGGCNTMDLIKNLYGANNVGLEIKSDKEYSYLLGQVVYFVNSFSKEAKEKRTMSYIGRYIDKKNVAKYLLRDMDKYSKHIQRSKLFAETVSKVMKYNVKDLDNALFLAGVLDDNMFYKKTTKNESEEI